MSLIKEYLLLLACFAYALVRGRAAANTKPASVVIVQMAKLGDMVCTTPLIHAAKAGLGARISIVGSAINKEVLAGSPDVGGYIVFGGIIKTIKLLRAARFDAALLTAPSAPLLAVLYLGGVRIIVAPKVLGGYSPLDTLAYRMMLKLVRTAPHTMGQYAPREYLRLLEPLGVAAHDSTKHLYCSKEAQEKAEALLGPARAAGKMLVGISPSAGNKVKNWPAERFAEVAGALAQKHNAAIVLFGGPRDRAEVAAMRAHLSPDMPLVDLAGKLSVDELKAAIAELDLFVAVDTGPIYIAEAFGVATVDIVGPMDEREQPPQGPRHIVVTPPFKRVPQLRILNAHPKDETEARRQTESITPEAVLEACAKLLQVL